jgi:hypothetical protein
MHRGKASFDMEFAEDLIALHKKMEANREPEWWEFEH